MRRKRSTAYALEWLDQRIDLAERTHELYRVATCHATFSLRSGPPALSSIGTPAVPPVVSQTSARTRATTAAKAYRLMSSIMRIRRDGRPHRQRNPCQVRGAAVERAPERPVATTVRGRGHSQG